MKTNIANRKIYIGTPPALTGLSEVPRQSLSLNDPSVRRRIEQQAKRYLRDRLVQDIQRAFGGLIKIR